jgi:hypothetical protein
LVPEEVSSRDNKSQLVGTGGSQFERHKEPAGRYRRKSVRETRRASWLVPEEVSSRDNKSQLVGIGGSQFERHEEPAGWSRRKSVLEIRASWLVPEEFKFNCQWMLKAAEEVTFSDCLLFCFAVKPINRVTNPKPHVSISHTTMRPSQYQWMKVTDTFLGPVIND